MLLHHIITLTSDSIGIRSTENFIKVEPKSKKSKRVDKKEDLEQFNEKQLVQIYNHLTHGSRITKKDKNTLDEIWEMLLTTAVVADNYYIVPSTNENVLTNFFEENENEISS